MPVRHALSVLALCLVGACTHLPPLDNPPVTPSPPASAGPAQKLELLPASPSPTPEPSPIPSGAHPDQMALIGMITVPRTVSGLANAHDGVVEGTPVEVLDVLTGQRLGLGSSFYDGSYSVKVPAAAAGRPVLLRSALVDAITHQPLCPLYAPVVLASNVEQQTEDIGAGTTAYVALLYVLAAKQASLPDADWTTMAFGAANRPLAQMVMGSQPAARASFATFVESGDNLGKPTNGAELRLAIGALVTKLAPTAVVTPSS